MPSRRNTTPIENDIIGRIRYLSAECTVQQIATSIGLSLSDTKRLCETYNIFPKNGHHDHSICIKVLEMYQVERNGAEIARALNITRFRVSQILTKLIKGAP